MLLGSSWWALVRRWHRRDFQGRSGFFREVSWEWCPESASYEKQICVMCPLVDWNSFLFELTVQCWQCPPPVRWCRPWACTRRALAVCHLDSMLCRARIGILEYFEKKTCGRVHKDSSIFQRSMNVCHHRADVSKEEEEVQKGKWEFCLKRGRWTQKHSHCFNKPNSIFYCSSKRTIEVMLKIEDDTNLLP